MPLSTEAAPAAGDAFTAEVAPHLHLLYRTALRMTQQEQAAEDLLQDTLERAFLNFARYEPGTNIRAWLLRIMSNVRISGFRRVARRPQTASLDELEPFSIYGAARADGIATADVESVVLNRIGSHDGCVREDDRRRRRSLGLEAASVEEERRRAGADAGEQPAPADICRSVRIV